MGQKGVRRVGVTDYLVVVDCASQVLRGEE